ncbi:MAG: ABC transporter substrate-binding protein [Alcaligenaceae bacterium]|nr:ABC transporter substrate-binding protein [Alcaligenaceae bacterium SAGV5]MPS51278.1 ABC transporter substrate-binding protein [Alcaligenaceae bacterium SAGV3]MPT57225.1 ABC transporter substrate-binding protein [Alcaligenaceae bacterium]
MKKQALVAAIAAGLVLGSTAPTLAQAPKISGDVIKIGFITDGSSVYADIDGPAGAEAIRMAVADAGGQINGKKIEVLYADHQNKPDIASARAREWIDQQGLDLLIGGTNSSTALAMATVATEKKIPYIVIGAGSSRLTNEDCSPYIVHYAYDTVALARGTGSAVVAQGGKSWFFLTADYAFGHSLEADTSAVVKAAGGTVVGSIRHPLAASDFSSFMLQAQASKAQILGMANAGGDFINATKAAAEFGVTKTMKIAGLLVFINDIHTLGLNATQGLYLTDGWYWDQSNESRAWAAKFEQKLKRKPSSLQAADYSAASFYLKAVKTTGTDDPDTIMKWFKSNKINDMFARDGYVRADGRMIYDMYLFQVKTPKESKGPWDYYKVAQKLPGDKVYTTPAESKCPLLKKS